MPEQDPELGRLNDALDRVERMESRAQRGEEITNAVIVSEMRTIREDLVAEKRERIGEVRKFTAAIEALEAAVLAVKQYALPRRPAIYIGSIIMAVVSGTAIVVLGALLTGTGSK